MKEQQIRLDKNGKSHKLIIGSKKYDLDITSLVNLTGKKIPCVRMDKIPDGVQIGLVYKNIVILYPPFFLDGKGNVGVTFLADARYVFDRFKSDPLQRFMKKSDFYLEVRSCPCCSNYCVVLDVPSRTLDVVFKKVEKLIDGFWKKFPKEYAQLYVDLDFNR